MQALRFSKDQIDAVSTLVELHLRFHGYGSGEWTDSAVRRYVRDAGPLLPLAARPDPRRLHHPQHSARPSGSGVPTTTSRSGSPGSPRRRSWPRSAPTSTATRSWRSSGSAPAARSARPTAPARAADGRRPDVASTKPRAAWWAAPRLARWLQGATTRRSRVVGSRRGSRGCRCGPVRAVAPATRCWMPMSATPVSVEASRPPRHVYARVRRRRSPAHPHPVPRPGGRGRSRSRLRAAADGGRTQDDVGRGRTRCPPGGEVAGPTPGRVTDRHRRRRSPGP